MDKLKFNHFGYESIADISMFSLQKQATDNRSYTELSKLDKSIIGLDYSYWVAQIDGDMSECTLFDLHQYTWVLSVGGISGDVDGNYIYNLNIVDKCS